MPTALFSTLMITDQERRTRLWLATVVLAASGLAAWAMYVDPDEGYNRWERYGWESWHVWGPLFVTLGIVATIILSLWLILRSRP
jgi:hypothetical protein